MKPIIMRLFTLFISFFLILTIGCSYTMKIHDGQTAYRQKQFAVAIPFLEKEYNRTKSPVQKGKIAYMLGESYRLTGQYTDAEQWFSTAYMKSYGPDALKSQALVLKQTERYEEAIIAFQELGREIGSPYEYKREIEACQSALDWLAKKDKSGYTIEEAPFNSSNNDFSPTLYQDDIVFVSDQQAATGEATYQWTNHPFMDLFSFDNTSIQSFDDRINTAANEGPACFNADFSEMYFTRCMAETADAIYCQIMTCEWDGRAWSMPSPLSFQEEGVNYMHPALSADGNTLIFASNHRDGWGGYDLYFSERGRNGWTNPQLLSRIINSIGNEVFPTFEADTLYFSSDYLKGMGGLDIFKTVKTGVNQWTPPKNLKSPINSGNDDFGLLASNHFNKSGLEKSGYFSSNRNGHDDIFEFRKAPVPVEVVEVPKEIHYKNFLKIITLEKIFADPDDPTSKVLGRKPMADAQLQIIKGKQKETFSTNRFGEFEFELSDESDYTFIGAKEAYLTNSAYFSTKGFGQDPLNPIQHYTLEIVLDKIYKDKEIRLENIYYDFNKWDIRKDAEPSLNQLVKMLLQNPDVKIELASHTDCRGTEKYNKELSQKRAESAVNYLLSHGVDSTQVIAKGYGESLPDADCSCNNCSEDQHQYNRRTSFKIL